jgi:3-phenylpropionate/cinnamic acid dioxygenase small subunit
MDLQRISDRLEIEDLLTRYAHAVDTKDWDLYRTVFTEDAFIDYESAGGIKGDLGTIVAWLAEALAAFPKTQHLVANIDARIDGDEAGVRAMFYNPMVMANGKNFFCGGYYNHTLVRTPEGWRSRRLAEESTWFEAMPADPSNP